MPIDDDQPWDQASDEQLIERLIVAIQQAVATTLAEPGKEGEWVVVPAPELATALLNLLASVLERSPECRTPMGMRRVSEAAGKRLLVLMRGFRDLGQSAGTDTTAH